MQVKHPDIITARLHRAIVQAVNRRLGVMETGVQSEARLSAFRGGESGTGRGFSQSSALFSSQYNSTGAPYSFIYHRHYVISSLSLAEKTNRLSNGSSGC